VADLSVVPIQNINIDTLLAFSYTYLGRFDEAERVFDRMLWLSPSDNQDVYFLIENVITGRSWEKPKDE
jgi:hypothetical protein